ncbi:uncharacterized protein LOC143451374 [Clavelina lepadiformis]|uniref:Uncharacterized protein n=1 Tax=Clavelina lepadiformis TaxID=159417 RepID=A0ABP0GZS8_CLALP
MTTCNVFAFVIAISLLLSAISASGFKGEREIFTTTQSRRRVSEELGGPKQSRRISRRISSGIRSSKGSSEDISPKRNTPASKIAQDFDEALDKLDELFADIEVFLDNQNQEQSLEPTETYGDSYVKFFPASKTDNEIK